MSTCEVIQPIDATEFPAAPSQGCAAPPQFHSAVEAWINVLGPEHVALDDGAIDRYARTTGTQSTRPLAILHPQNTAEVCDILRIASKHLISVYPISRGKNWGYGDANPSGQNQVILDLGRMNRILEVNAKMCYAVIEPGVTQGQLHKYLTDHNMPLWMDCTAAGPEASIVGNTLDRGFGHTRYGDRFLQSCGMEVVLADGRVLNTGFGHYANSQAHRVYRYGVGPFLDGIFSQSNYGVVTQMGVWLMPAPEDFEAFFLSTPNEQDMPHIIDRLAPLRMQGLLQSAVHVANDLRAVSGRMSYPWQRAGGRTPLPAELRAELRGECKMGAWNACGAVYGTRETVRAARKVLRRTLADFNPVFLNDRRLRAAHAVRRALGWFGKGHRMGERLEVVTPVYGLLKGIPTREPLRGAAWRLRGEAPAFPTDPLECNAGLLWLSPTLPASGAAAQDLMNLIDPVYRKYGFETLVTFTMITERALCCVTNVAFDRREPDEVERARDCYEELTDLVMRNGYILYRSGLASMPKLHEDSSVFWDVAAQLKNTLDPRGIISPGRYIPAA